MPKRRWVFAGIAGVLSYPFVRLSAAVNDRGFHEKAIRPPGSVEEKEFLERCIKCDQCINVCPTNVLQPSTLAQGGLEGLWNRDMFRGICSADDPGALMALIRPELRINKDDLVTAMTLTAPVNAN